MSGICDMCARRECIGRDDARKQCDKYLVSDLLHICDNCTFFDPQLDHGQKIECEDDGTCRKNPPTILPMGEDGGFAALFPPVNREDWCGGWKEVMR